MNDNPAVVVLNKGVEPLNVTHNRKGFDCGVPALNDFLQKFAGQKSSRNQVQTYVLSADDNETIIGYFTLTMTRFNWHETVGKKSKTVDTAALIARLAVDKRFTGQGVGLFLLRTALEKLIIANDILGVPIIVVDAKDGVSAFYETVGFQFLEQGSSRLFITMETILNSQKIK
ncbi:GNAT family N-acetyltransferase [Kingella oralis]|jgi:hypothetical protein|uniref:GNAT family N-acetyltransferase n=1 Tax=Kingella oralis TaxID=505 RepID=UPI002D7EFA43|nr:GNAT family N-acetyltransferase [Kingella oralis]